MRASVGWSLLAVAVLAGCGVDPQAAPEVLSLAPPTPVTSEPDAAPTGTGVPLWFLQDDRLVPVERVATAADPATALALLAEGPDPAEVGAGLGTALAPQPLAVVPSAPGEAPSTLTVEVTPAFTGVAGENQLRAVAQVVWTATAFDGVDAVRFTTDGEALEVPTDEGLTAAPVDREDYASVAPPEPGSAEAETPAGTTPVGTPSASRPSPTGRRPACCARVAG